MKTKKTKKKAEIPYKRTDFKTVERYEFPREQINVRFMQEIDKIIGTHHAALFPSVSALARALGYQSPQLFSNIRAGKNHVTLQMIAGIHQIAGHVIDIRYILSGNYSKEDDKFGLPKGIISVEEDKLNKVKAYADLIGIEINELLHKRR